jgi:hypothetical protein
MDQTDSPLNYEEEDVDTNMEDFMPVAPEQVGVDMNQVITIRTAAGGANYVAAPEALTLKEVMEKSGLTFGAGVQVFMNNAIISDDTVVPSGSTVVAVGSVKGGVCDGGR